jgi:phosphocarrier protein
MSTRRLKIINRLGLHARAAAKFVQLASRFQASVRVTNGTTTMDGKSILGLLLLAAAQGTTITIETDGRDAEAALEALAALVAAGFEES